MIHFKPLRAEHLELVYIWFNKPHVQAFYSLRNWTIEEVKKKLLPYIDEKSQIKPFIIFYNNSPIGYIQFYPIKNFPWENEDLSQKVMDTAAGLDLFIGSEQYINKGLGFEILNTFLEQQVWPFFSYCIVDPDIRNEVSISLFQKSGFQIHKKIISENALKEKVQLVLYTKARDIFVRELIISDISLLAQRFCFPWTTEELTKEKWNKYLAEQQSKIRTVFVIEKENLILGYASLLYSSDYSYFRDKKIPEIQDLWIDEAHRNAGFGTMLIKHVESFAKEKGYNQIGLGVGLYKDYGAAQQLYPKLGYVPDGFGVTYKTKFVKPGESYPIDDDLILWLTKTL